MASAFPPFDGSAPKTQDFSEAPEMGIDPSKRYTAKLDTTLGEIVIALDAVKAPNTVNNFVFLALHHYYDGVIFHRIINGFMCQGGDPTGTGRGGPGYTIENEIDPELLDPQDPDMVQDLVLAAVNDANRQVDLAIQKQVGGLAPGLGIPGLS